MKKLSLSYINLVIVHIFIGLAIFAFEGLSKFYFLGVIAYLFFAILQAPIAKKPVLVLISCSFIIGCEVFLRMTGGNLLYEISKYSVIMFLLLGIFYLGISRKSFSYIVYALLLVPGIILTAIDLDYQLVFRKLVAFNLSGPVCLALAAIFCYNLKVTWKDIDHISQAIILPIISNTVYIYLYNPNIKDVLHGTQSNFESSGGFGPNQVATVLGMGMFFLVLRFFVYSKNIFHQILNISLFGLVSFRAIVTFSRGGVITAIVIILAFMFFYFRSSSGKERLKMYKSIGIIVFTAIGIWVYSSIQTLGYIDKRYANQDAAGRVKEDITTGRVNLLTYEFSEFFNNPFLGVGVGRIKQLRFEKSGVAAASHNEMSRLLSEHGMFGLLALVILLIAPLIFRIKDRRNYLFFSFYFFWFLTINHSSMRIAAPAFIYGLCLLSITDEKNSLHRQQVIQEG